MAEATKTTGHKMPESLERAGKGRYRVKGTELAIVQGDDGKWKVEGHSDDLGAFGSRGAALGKLQELGAVPEVPAEQPVQPQAEKRPVLDPTDASGAEGANGGTGEKRRPRARKPRAKADAKV
jgi:hypothetical protein